ncbi:MAG TPA: hypothetical protein VF793_11970 [Telluria sp.]|jgi:hypothetical protein
MPTYRVWYRDNEDPLEFVTEGRYSDEQILDRILAHENISASGFTPGQGGEAASAALPLKELIIRNHLAPVRYIEDESEMNTIE